MDDLLPIFRYEQSQYHEHLDKRQFLNIYKSEGYIRAINEIESNDRFIWMYNFAIIFFHMDPVLSTVTAEHEKEELIIKLRTLYSYDIEALNEIEDFNKDYNTENPIKSYDKMKSIREILNKALRQKDFELIELAPFNIISEFDEIVQFWISNENLKTNQISLGLMMIQTGKLNEAKKYYESLIKYLPDNHPLEKYCKYSLGNLAQKKGEIDDAEKYYNEAFENQVDTLLRARVTCALANIYFSKNDKSKAFEYYKLALSMFNKNHKDFILDIIECYTGIGKYYQTSQIDKDYEKALKSFTNAINELDNWISKNIRQEKSPQADEKSAQQNELTTIDENLEQHDKVSEFDEKPAQRVKLPQVDEKSAEHDELIPIDEKPAERDELSTIDENLEQHDKVSEFDEKPAQYAILPQLDEKPVKRDELPLNNEKPANHGKFQPPGEARGEPYEAQTWVAWVIKNRALLNRSYWGGNTIKGVCLQPGQFECWNDRSNIEINEPEAYARISQLANDIFYANQSQDPTGGANHYNHPAKEGYPPWTQNCLRLRKIGNYQFYKSL
ncbi:unnamed protein product [Rotaria sp. Silwood1]|nr:unnamed protein product [Rotaria sp. Silwood1]